VSTPLTEFDRFKANLFRAGAETVPHTVDLSSWGHPDVSDVDLRTIESYEVQVTTGGRRTVEWNAQLTDGRRVFGGVAITRSGGVPELYVSALELRP
jgi:hypothetical protein